MVATIYIIMAALISVGGFCLPLAEIIESDDTEVPLRILNLCHICFASWTDKSNLFSERLVCSSSFGGLFLQQLVSELKIYTAMWAPSEVRVVKEGQFHTPPFKVYARYFIVRVCYVTQTCVHAKCMAE